jgi:hypothetical protein
MRSGDGRSLPHSTIPLPHYKHQVYLPFDHEVFCNLQSCLRGWLLRYEAVMNDAACRKKGSQTLAYHLATA